MEEKIIEMKRNKITVFFCSACFLLFVAILILVMVSGAIKDIQIFENANFVEVEATIVKYEDRIVDSYIHYSTYYEYKSPNGGIYSGCWQARIKTEEEAKAQIGMKVPLYIDDELHLQTKSLKTDKTGVIVGGVFGSICLLGSIGFFAYLAIYFVRWLKMRSNNDKGLCYKQNNDIKRPRNFVFFHQMILLFSIFMIGGCIASSITKENTYQKYINAEFVEVVGEICEYKEFEKDNSPYYATYYKYVSEEGEEYIDIWKNDIYSKDDAEATIGSEVPLFYDKEFGVLKSMNDLEPVSKPDHTLNIILAVVFVVLFVNSLARFIRFIIRNKRYKKQQGNSNG